MDSSASWSNAEGEKSRSQLAQPTQRSTAVTSTDLPWSKGLKARQYDGTKTGKISRYAQVALIFLPQTGLSLGLTPL